MSINVNSYSSISSRTGVSGLMSGLETDEIVEGLTSATRNRITKTLQNKQILSWKKSAYQDISTDLSDFYGDYFRFSSSSSSIFNKGFFKSTSIESSSPYVTATGDNDTIENLVIKDIKNLAKKTTLSSSHLVSGQELSGTSKIYDTWQDNTMAGEYIKINYGGKAYNIRVDSGFYLDSTLSDSDKISGFINELNNQISKYDDLNGNIEFKVESDGVVSLSETGGSTGDLKITGGTTNILNATGFYPVDEKTAGSLQVKGDYKIEAQSLYEKNIFSSGSINLQINNSAQTTLKLDSNFRFSKSALEKDSSGNFTANAVEQQRVELQVAYNEAVKKNSNLNKKIKVVVENVGDLQVRIEALDKNDKIKVTGGDETLLDSLGLKVTGSSEEGKNEIIGTVNPADITQSETKTLNEVLSGTTLTFSFNGVDEKIEFNESEKDQYSTVNDLKDYIQTKLDKEVGAGKVNVNVTDDKLSFTTNDPSHTIAITSSSASGVLQKNGALHIAAGSSNRVEFGKTLDELKDKMSVPLTADSDGTYKISINGKELSFDGDTSFGNMIAQINSDDDLGIEISYSTISDSFSVQSKEAGADEKIEFDNVGASNLATCLFGTKDDVSDGYTVNAGQDFNASISFDGGNTFMDVNRQRNSFEMDGVTFTFKGKADGTEDENVTFTKNNNIDDVVDKITKFVDDYNKIVEKIQSKTTEKRYGVDFDSKEKYPPLTDQQKENMSDSEIEKWEERAKMGLLQNDSTLDKILRDLRSSMSNMVEGEGALFEMGITTGEYKLGGTLLIDEDKLRSAIAKDPNKLSNIFTSENGIAERLSTVLKEAVIGEADHEGSLITLAGKSTTGAFGKSSLEKQIQDYDKTLENLKDKLTTEETRYYNQFSRLEVLVGQLNSQSEYLTSIMG